MPLESRLWAFMKSNQDHKSLLGIIKILFLFAAAFVLGHLAAFTQDVLTANASPASAAEGSWGLSFQESGQKPVANTTAAELKPYDAHYVDETDEKVLYLTFDAGFENGNTPAILAALKKHQAPATFFLVGNYLSTSPELVKQMVDEGHIVANHTYHHLPMSKMTSLESFSEELDSNAALFKEITGQEMVKYYRPPSGIYSLDNLQMAKDLGYHTFFWSLAYVDWYENQQPSHAEALDKLISRIHPGAIVLLHSTSKTNGEIMDELLTKWEEMGYTFKSLDELVAKEAQQSST